MFLLLSFDFDVCRQFQKICKKIFFASAFYAAKLSKFPVFQNQLQSHDQVLECIGTNLSFYGEQFFFFFFRCCAFFSFFCIDFSNWSTSNNFHWELLSNPSMEHMMLIWCCRYCLFREMFRFVQFAFCAFLFEKFNVELSIKYAINYFSMKNCLTRKFQFILLFIFLLFSETWQFLFVSFVKLSTTIQKNKHTCSLCT